MSPSDRAHEGIKLVEEAILQLLTHRADWMTRSEIAKTLDIDRFAGYLTGGICNDLVTRGVLEFETGNGPGEVTRYRVRRGVKLEE